MKRGFIGLLGAAVVAISSAASDAATFYTNESSFLAATSGLNSESFETVTASGASVTFAGGSFTCSGATYCPGFFGVTSFYSLDGNSSLFFASPDSVTFNFGSTISSFGVFIGNAGDVAPVTLALTSSNGTTSNLFVNHSGPGTVFQPGDLLFAGLVDPLGFTSITFSPSNANDGLYFDLMQSGSSELSAVPVPAALPLALTGFGLIGALGWRRRQRA
jgi:hypothetical protein